MLRALLAGWALHEHCSNSGYHLSRILDWVEQANVEAWAPESWADNAMPSPNADFRDVVRGCIIYLKSNFDAIMPMPEKEQLIHAVKIASGIRSRGAT